MNQPDSSRICVWVMKVRCCWKHYDWVSGVECHSMITSLDFGINKNPRSLTMRWHDLIISTKDYEKMQRHSRYRKPSSYRDAHTQYMYCCAIPCHVSCWVLVAAVLGVERLPLIKWLKCMLLYKGNKVSFSWHHIKKHHPKRH